jgi:hypothetical protein
MMPPPSAADAGAWPLPSAGLLTAGVWDDNLNFAFYRKYHQRVVGMEAQGLPRIPIADRLVVLVQDAAGKAVAGATVTASSGGRALSSTTTGADGRALFFRSWLGVQAGSTLQITAVAGGAMRAVEAGAEDGVATVALAGTSPPVAALDLALVIDTTGSMADEIRYLQAEVLAISSAIREAYPLLQQRWALVPYKDEGDSWVVRPSDFTGDLAGYQASLRALSADGGGDYPEASDQALAALDQLTWHPGARARMAFWIADAPHHLGREERVVEAIRAAHARGVHLYPVAASGVDDLTEFSMRLAALVTGGRYLFLTNDSGIGNDHKEPAIPCYHVTNLKDAMLRMIAMEVTGVRLEPAPAEVIRTGGNPRDGRCQLRDGEVVEAL